MRPIQIIVYEKDKAYLLPESCSHNECREVGNVKIIIPTFEFFLCEIHALDLGMALSSITEATDEPNDQP